MKEKKSWVSCNCNKEKLSFYPFLLPIIFMIIRYLQDKMFEFSDVDTFIDSQNTPTFRILKYNLPFLFYYYLPKIFSIFLIFIVKHNIKGESEGQKIIEKKYHFMIKNDNKKKILILVYIISLLEVICETSNCLLYYYQRTEGRIRWLVETKTIYIIFVPFFCYFIINKEFHRHYLLGLFLGIIGACIINICRFFLDFSRIDDYPFHLLNIFLSSLHSLALVLIKYVMSKYLILSPHIFLFYNGIFCILNSLICILLEYPIVVNLKDEILEENDKYFSNNYLEIFTIFYSKKWEFYVYFFGSFILSFIYYILNVLTIYNFSPFLFILIESILPIDNDFLAIFFRGENRDKDKILERTYIQAIGYGILFFASLILNEIIIFNFFGLNKNTKRKITIRAELDSCILRDVDNYSEETDNEDDIDNNENEPKEETENKAN